MKLAGRVIAVTGGGSGLGAAVCRLARDRGAAHIAVIDRDRAAAEELAREVDGTAYEADVTDEAQIRPVIEQIGPIDIYLNNAGVGLRSSTFTGNDTWRRMWDVHVMAIVYASRALLPQWLERGEGHLCVVASANALTSNPVSAAYAVSKHAELALTEWLQLTYASRGITASCFCPKGMMTPMTLASVGADKYVQSAIDTAVTPTEAAQILLDMVEAGRFLATTYPPVLEEYRLRASDPDAYLAMMQAVHDDLVPHVGSPPTVDTVDA